MCTDDTPAALSYRQGSQVLHDFEPTVVIELEPVDSVVARTTGYEPGFPPQQAWLGGAWQPDPLVLDDQALVIDVKDKGLVVLTGCGHAGVINICRYVQRLTGDRPLYAVIGGFHLNGPVFEPLIPQILDDLAALAPSVIVPAHCTGWRGAARARPAVPRCLHPRHRRHPLRTLTQQEIRGLCLMRRAARRHTVALTHRGRERRHEHRDPG